MATEREQDESDESMDESHESSHDTDAPDDSEAAQAAQDDEDEEQEREDDGRILTRPEDEAYPSAGPQPCRTPRRQEARLAKPAREDRNAKVAEQAVPGGAPRARSKCAHRRGARARQVQRQQTTTRRYGPRRPANGSPNIALS